MTCCNSAEANAKTFMKMLNFYVPGTDCCNSHTTICSVCFDNIGYPIRIFETCNEPIYCNICKSCLETSLENGIAKYSHMHVLSCKQCQEELCIICSEDRNPSLHQGPFCVNCISTCIQEYKATLFCGDGSKGKKECRGIEIAEEEECGRKCCR